MQLFEVGEYYLRTQPNNIVLCLNCQVKMSGNLIKLLYISDGTIDTALVDSYLFERFFRKIKFEDSRNVY
jgi:hypothetical protein